MWKFLLKIIVVNYQGTESKLLEAYCILTVLFMRVILLWSKETALPSRWKREIQNINQLKITPSLPLWFSYKLLTWAILIHRENDWKHLLFRCRRATSRKTPARRLFSILHNQKDLIQFHITKMSRTLRNFLHF